MAWKILLGYLPTNASRRQQTLERKRAEYKEAIRQHYNIDDNSRTLQEQETLRQVLVDVPRTAPEVPLFRNEKIKRSLARLLYTWAMRHPASSYVQGINDLATPLFAVFLADDYEGEDIQDGSVMVVLSPERLDEVRERSGSSELFEIK
jgi:TBC1 domain family member 2